MTSSRVVAAGTDAGGAEPLDLATAAATGDRVQALTALRDLLAGRIPYAEDRALPGLAKQFRDTVAELERLGHTVEVTPLDEREARVVELASRRRSSAPSA